MDATISAEWRARQRLAKISLGEDRRSPLNFPFDGRDDDIIVIGSDGGGVDLARADSVSLGSGVSLPTSRVADYKGGGLVGPWRWLQPTTISSRRKLRL
jgi:hypothetical protein